VCTCFKSTCASTFLRFTETRCQLGFSAENKWPNPGTRPFGQSVEKCELNDHIPLKKLLNLALKKQESGTVELRMVTGLWGSKARCIGAMCITPRCHGGK